MVQETFDPLVSVIDDLETATAALREKMVDACVPGYRAEFAPDEADLAGAFIEDALTEQYAAESDTELIEAIRPVPGNNQE